MTQQEQKQQERAIQALLYTFYALVAVVLLATLAGVRINGFEMVGLCIGTGIAYPFVYWMVGKR